MSAVRVTDAPGRGLGRPAMEAICARVFDDWGIERFWLDVFEDNARARRVYASLGFRETGRSHPPHLPRGDGGTPARAHGAPEEPPV